MLALEHIEGPDRDVIQIALPGQSTFGQAFGPARIEIDAERVHAAALPGQFEDHFADDVRAGGADPEPRLARISTIRFLEQRPADYWAERGYDWYSEH